MQDNNDFLSFEARLMWFLLVIKMWFTQLQGLFLLHKNSRTFVRIIQVYFVNILLYLLIFDFLLFFNQKNKSSHLLEKTCFS